MENWYLKNNYLFDRSNLNFIREWWLDIDRVNYLLIICVIIFGLFMTITSSPYVARKIGVEDLFFVKKQMVFILIALVILTSISFLSRDQIKVLSIFGLLISICLLVTTLIVGFEIKGAKRWISIIGLTLQPSELAKVFFLIFNAFILSKTQDRDWKVKYGISAGLYCVFACLFMLQPDFGMTFILTVVWLAQLFVFGLSVYVVIAFIVMGAIGTLCAYKILPHVASRIDKFLDIDVKNYQVERSIDAYSNGGFFGTGLGNGLVKKYIPDAHTDFIFAVISEEFGVLFAIILILLLFFIITRVIKKIFKEDDMFIYLAVTGLISLFTLQILINIGVSLALLPTKGMTLPFISYGGSSIIAMSFCFGSILALTKNRYDRDNQKKYYSL